METEDWLFGSGDELPDQQVLPPFTNNFQRWMTLPEERAMSLSKLDLENGIDPVFVSMALYKEQYLPDGVYRKVTSMLQNGCDRTRICDYLFEQIPSYISLHNFVTVLDKCGYTSLSALLLVNSFKWNSPYVSAPNMASSSSSAFNLYSNLKRLVNNAQVKKPELFLRKMANKCYNTMKKETDPGRKQRLADNCVAIISAETDTIAITFDKTLCKHVLFTQMKRLSQETSNTLISDVGCYGRLANAYAIAGDYSMCEKMLDEAKCKAYITGPCIEFVQLMYIIAYVTLWEFESCPTVELRSKLLLWCRVGLKCVEEDFVGNKNKWRRLLMLRMLLCLLGLGNRATVIEHCPVDELCIAEAKRILAEFDKYWDGIETRRQMLYYVAKARLCELEKRYLDAFEYLKMARKQAIKGQFEEIKFIRAYYKTVCVSGCNTESRIQPGDKDCVQSRRNSKESQKTKSPHIESTRSRENWCQVPETQDNTESIELGTRPQPIGSSCPLQDMLYFEKKGKFEAKSDSRQQNKKLPESKTALYLHPAKRFTPSLEFHPDITRGQVLECPVDLNETNEETQGKHDVDTNDGETSFLNEHRTYVKTFCRGELDTRKEGNSQTNYENSTRTEYVVARTGKVYIRGELLSDALCRADVNAF